MESVEICESAGGLQIEHLMVPKKTECQKSKRTAIKISLPNSAKVRRRVINYDSARVTVPRKNQDNGVPEEF